MWYGPRSTQITLADEQYERLRAESRRSGLGLAELVRRAADLTYGSARPEETVRALDATFGGSKGCGAGWLVASPADGIVVDTSVLIDHLRGDAGRSRCATRGRSGGRASGRVGVDEGRNTCRDAYGGGACDASIAGQPRPD